MTKHLIVLSGLILSSCAQDLVEIKVNITSLVAQAKRYQLQKPPANARLILANTGYTTTSSNRSSDLDPSIYEPGFLSESKADGKAIVMTGFQKSTPEGHRKHQPVIIPFSAKPTKSKPGHYVFRGNSQASFGTAIQCARRGDLSNAKALFENFYRSKYKDFDRGISQTYLLPENAPIFLAFTTFNYHYQKLRKKRMPI